MKKNTVIMAVVGALAAGALVSGATVAFAQADVIKARHDNRVATGPEMRAIKAVIDAKGDLKEIVPRAAKLKELEIAFDKMFPKGSEGGKSKPEVWSDAAGFAAAGKTAQDAYDKLAMAAGSGDQAATAAAFGDVGKSCGGCHTNYREKLN